MISFGFDRNSKFRRYKLTHHFIQHLLKDHETQRNLAQKLTEAEMLEDKRDLRQSLYDALYPHIEGEDASIFPFLKRANGQARQGALEAMQEHHVDRLLLDELIAADPEDEEFLAKAKVLQEINAHHLEEEEEKHFPRLEDLADEDQLNALFESYESAEENFNK